MIFQEHHEETKANKDHHMYVLEKWVFGLCYLKSSLIICFDDLRSIVLIELSEEAIEEDSDSFRNDEY